MKPSLILLALFMLLAGCAGDNAQTAPALDLEDETEAHETVRQFLHAHIDQDWDRVYDLMTEDHRPSFREQWETHRASGPPDKCVGDSYGTPIVDLETLTVWSVDELVVESTVWEQSNQGRVCRWTVERVDGTWRVGPSVARAQDGR